MNWVERTHVLTRRIDDWIDIKWNAVACGMSTYHGGTPDGWFLMGRGREATRPVSVNVVMGLFTRLSITIKWPTG